MKFKVEYVKEYDSKKGFELFPGKVVPRIVEFEGTMKEFDEVEKKILCLLEKETKKEQWG